MRSRQQRILDNDAEYVTPGDMLAELRDDNLQLIASMNELHELCEEHKDVATASFLEVWIDQAERRVRPRSVLALSAAKAKARSWFLPAELAKIYQFPDGDGAAQSIGLLEFGAVEPREIAEVFDDLVDSLQPVA